MCFPLEDTWISQTWKKSISSEPTDLIKKTKLRLKVEEKMWNSKMDIIKDNWFKIKTRHGEKISRNYVLEIMAWNNT